MKKQPYKRKPGDFEIRILKDGKVVMVVPDQDLVEIAKTLDPAQFSSDNETEKVKNARTSPASK